MKLSQSEMVRGAMSSTGVWSIVFSEVHSLGSHLPRRSRPLLLPTCFTEILVSFSVSQVVQVWTPAHLSRVSKTGSVTMMLLCMIGQQNWPDLNLIENIWVILKRNIKDNWPNNADSLKAAIKVTWASITSQQRQRLIVSMPRPSDAVSHAKGGLIKY